MLASITPLGERGRGRRWELSAPAYVAGSALGGLLSGALAGAAGWGAVRLGASGGLWQVVVLAVAVVLAIAVDLRVLGVRPIGPRRQVNEDWLDIYREWVYGGGFGAQLGAGVVTQVSTAGVWVLLLCAALTGSVTAGALIGGLFGLVRALPILTTAGVRDAGSLGRLHAGAAAWERRAHLFSTYALAGAGVVLVAVAVLDIAGRGVTA